MVTTGKNAAHNVSIGNCKTFMYKYSVNGITMEGSYTFQPRVSVYAILALSLVVIIYQLLAIVHLFLNIKPLKMRPRCCKSVCSIFSIIVRKFEMLMSGGVNRQTWQPLTPCLCRGKRLWFHLFFSGWEWVSVSSGSYYFARFIISALCACARGLQYFVCVCVSQVCCFQIELIRQNRPTSMFFVSFFLNFKSSICLKCLRSRERALFTVVSNPHKRLCILLVVYQSRGVGSLYIEHTQMHVFGFKTANLS